MKKTFVSLTLAALLTASCASVSAPPKTVAVRLLGINDFHGRLEPPAGLDGQVGGVPAGGVEYLATHLKAAALDHPNTLIVAGGDLFGATPLLSAMFKDAPTIEAVDALGVVATALGNHELDRGKDGLTATIRTAKVRYLAANAVRTGPPVTPLLPPTWIVETGGVKIGFIGEILHNVPAVTAAKALEGLAFSDEADAANAAVKALQAEGVQTIVLLIHEGGRQTVPPGGALDPNGCAGFYGDILPILDRLSPAIRVVVSGHTHQPYNCEIGGRRVTNGGAYGRGYTVIDLVLDARSGKVARVSAANRTTTRDVAKDPAQTAIIEKYRPQAAALAGRVVGAVSAPIEARLSPAGESRLGDVIADAGLASARDWAPDAQVAFTNVGGLRAGLGDATGPGPVPITFGQLYETQPFGNRLTAVTLTGDALLRLLNQQFAPDVRDVLQVSKSLTYRYRLNAPDGQYVEPGSLRINGRVVQPTDKVRLIVPDFVLLGGDGHTVFREGADPVIGPEDIEALTAYFATASPVAPGPQDRIVRID